MARKGLGKGLDSLIPDFYDDDFDSNSTQSLEDILSDDDVDIEEIVEEDSSNEVEESNQIEEMEEVISNEEVNKDASNTDEENETSQIQDPQVQQNIEEVKAIVDKNPRITLWSSRSSAVFRYLRKTEPEFSISKEASTIIDEAVSKKYPEIWKLFEDSF